MSALTFNVASKYVFKWFGRRGLLTNSSSKTTIILTYGWVSEGRILTAKDSLGIILALGGATLYSQLSQK